MVSADSQPTLMRESLSVVRYQCYLEDLLFSDQKRINMLHI